MLNVLEIFQTLVKSNISNSEENLEFARDDAHTKLWLYLSQYISFIILRLPKNMSDDTERCHSWSIVYVKSV